MTRTFRKHTTQGLYNSLGIFEVNEISLENLKGFVRDSASVMMGEKSGVKALLPKRVPAILVQACACHSITLGASNAYSKLP